MVILIKILKNWIFGFLNKIDNQLLVIILRENLLILLVIIENLHVKSDFQQILQIITVLIYQISMIHLLKIHFNKAQRNPLKYTVLPNKI